MCELGLVPGCQSQCELGLVVKLVDWLSESYCNNMTEAKTELNEAVGVHL